MSCKRYQFRWERVAVQQRTYHMEAAREAKRDLKGSGSLEYKTTMQLHVRAARMFNRYTFTHPAWAVGGTGF